MKLRKQFCYFQAYTDGKGVDVILEMLTNVNLANDLQILSKNGRVIVSVGGRRVLCLFKRALFCSWSGVRISVSFIVVKRFCQHFPVAGRRSLAAADPPR